MTRPRGYTAAWMSQSSLRAPGALGPLAVIAAAGRRTAPLVSRPTGPAAFAGPTALARPSTCARSATTRPWTVASRLLSTGAAAHPHLVKRLRELRHLAAIEFAVAVGIEFKGVIDQSLRRRRSAPAAARAARTAGRAASGRLSRHHRRRQHPRRHHHTAQESFHRKAPRS